MDFENPELNIKWLPLAYYDDCTQEQLFIDDYINFEEVFTDEEGVRISATGQALWRMSEDSAYKWLTVEVLGVSERDRSKLRC